MGTVDPQEVRDQLTAALRRRADAVRSGRTGRGPLVSGSPSEVAGGLERCGYTPWCRVLDASSLSEVVHVGSLARWPVRGLVVADDGSWVAEVAAAGAWVWSTAT